MHIERAQAPEYKPLYRRRPPKVRFYDEIARIGFVATIPFVKNGIHKATALLQQTDFVALEELYSFWGISEFVAMLKPGTTVDIGYLDLREVLGWHLLQGIRSVDIDLIPAFDGNKGLYVKIVYNDVPEFWDVRDLLFPSDVDEISALADFNQQNGTFYTRYPSAHSYAELIKAYETRKKII